jgi:thiol-disulfide isomerase/thioredoxin
MEAHVMATTDEAGQQVENAFDGAVDWINTSGPIRWKDLRGKVVLLDFWTYCCINCHHVLPDLEKLEKKYGNSLVVIGVHTAKFDAEKDTENIRKKVREYRIGHPVINDANMAIWTRFGVRSWPTLVLIDAEGKYIGYMGGEGHYDVLDRAVGKYVDEARAKRVLNETPLYFGVEKDKPSNGPLLYPGKILADVTGKRLFISDTGHNRIVITDLEGKAEAVVGNGGAGHADGPFDKAMFNRQQGLCLVGDTLYVADVESHMIRAVDLNKKTVTTVAGTGKQGNLRRGGGEAPRTPLNSPWDLASLPGTNFLAVAMAGTHQIWRFDPAKGQIFQFAGSGMENCSDGNLDQSAFAQPSGLATDGKELFVADSEASAVRVVHPGDRRVGTVVGTHDLPQGQSLFAFGDQDGKYTNARLQHCLGLAYADGLLYVADTYNSKIKECDPRSKTIKTLAGTGREGVVDGQAAGARFDQPGGLSVAGRTLYIADSNNHAIRTINLETREVATLELTGIEAPTPPRRAPSFANAKVVRQGVARVDPGRSRLTIDVSVALPEGFKINPEAPMPYQVEAPKGLAQSPRVDRVEPPSATFPIEVELAKESEPGDKLDLKLSISLFLCKEGGDGYCEVRSLICELPVHFEDGAPDKVGLMLNPGRE